MKVPSVDAYFHQMSFSHPESGIKTKPLQLKLQLMQTVEQFNKGTTFLTKENADIWRPNLRPMQMAPSGGQICN